MYLYISMATLDYFTTATYLSRDDHGYSCGQYYHTKKPARPEDFVSRRFNSFLACKAFNLFNDPASIVDVIYQ